MRFPAPLAQIAVWSSAIALCLPHALAEPRLAGSAPEVVDIVLLEGNVLIGRTVDAKGAALAGVSVSLWRGGKQVALAASDQNGYFAFPGLQSGVVYLAAAGSHCVCRLWPAQAAPPAALRGVLLVEGRQVARGQWGRPLSSLLNNPWLVAGIVATAVAVPVTIAGNQGPSSP